MNITNSKETMHILNQEYATIENLSDAETAILESVCMGLKALRMYSKQHSEYRDAAQKFAKEAKEQGDAEAYNRWMEMYWREESARNLLSANLFECGVPDKYIPK